MKRYSYKVVGVTFPARDGSDRQENLAQLFDEDMDLGASMHGVKLEGYDFEGAPALAVLLDGKEVGNIPADKVMDVIEIGRKATVCEVTLTLNGRDFEDAKDIIEFYRDRHEMVKDGTIHELDLDDIEENYTELMKDGAVYGAVVHFLVMDKDEAEKHQKLVDRANEWRQEENETKKKLAEEKPKKEYPGWMWKVSFGLSIATLLIDVLLVAVSPVPAIIIGVVAVVNIVNSWKHIKGTTGQKQK